MKLSESTSVAMPIRNLISIIAAVAIGVWAFFGIQETLNRHATQLEIMDKDLTLNTEFRNISKLLNAFCMNNGIFNEFQFKMLNAGISSLCKSARG